MLHAAIRNEYKFNIEMSITMSANEVSHLVQLNAEEARETLPNISRHTALNYLSELFHGNGWIVSFTNAQPDKTLLLSGPKTPHTILLMVKFIIQPHALTYTEAHEALTDFENNLAPQYKCTQFAIIAVNGIAKNTEKLEQFNLLLQEWSYVEDLIKHYNPGKIKEPRIELFAHNKRTYKKVRRMMSSTKSIAVVQATGTGKSFLIAKLLQDFAGEKRLVMAPSVYIIEQVKEHIRWDADRIEFMTYARSMNLSQSEIASLNMKMIVLDEFHRCGAEEWGRGVQNILNAFPDAFKFGTSATPVRYMDNGRDMSKELFGNNVAENLSLAQAIIRNILPMPKYVCALYSLKEELNNLKEKIHISRSTETAKNKMLLELDAMSINWELSNGVPAVLKKHLRKNMRKFIIFCKDEAHLLEMEPVVCNWFAEATGNNSIQAYRIFDNEPMSDANLENFKTADTNTAIHLLFSINMLNEGLHVNEVSGVLLLRPTLSPNIFYQQIGRCLKVGLNHTPVIFDLVNNFKSIRTHDFLYDLEFARSEYAAERGNENLRDNAPVFTLTDEVREITEVFGEIKFRLDDWDAMYERLVAYKELFGTCNVSAAEGHEEYKTLWNWLHNLRKRFQNGLLETDRRDKLIALGVDWKLHQLTGSQDEGWEKKFLQLSAFRKQYGHCNVTDKYKDFSNLEGFVRDQRTRYKAKTLEAYRIDKLLTIGFEFERQKKFREGRWQLYFDALIAHKNEHGHLNVSHRENLPLVQWICAQRRLFRKNELDITRQQKLNSIGFEWKEEQSAVFEKKVIQLIAWYHKNQHFKIPPENKLYYFVTFLRTKYKQKKIPAELIARLEAIGFNFEFREANILLVKKRLQQLREYYKLNGHGNVSRNNETHPGLAEWIIGQRKQYAKGILKKSRLKKLEALGVKWGNKKSQIDELWNNRYEKLLSLYQTHGNNFLLKARRNTLLNNWCRMQRQKYKQQKLTAEQVNKLNAFGFKWDYFQDAWEENFEILLAYKKEHGHCRVFQKKPETYSLSVWCGNARKAYNDGRLAEEKIKRLESIGFIWNIFEALWYEMYESLKKYLEQNSWPNLYSKNPSLHGWISKQRKEYKEGMLAEEKMMLLNMLGIEWTPDETKWQIMFQEFVKYRQVYNTGKVPHADKSLKQLWLWCVTQRKKYRKNKIPPTELQLLNEAGFVWEVKRMVL